MEGLFFISSKYPVTKGFKFHARPQTGAYSCFCWSCNCMNMYMKFQGSMMSGSCISRTPVLQEIPVRYIDRRRFMMQIEGRVFSQTIQDTDFSDPHMGPHIQEKRLNCGLG